MRIHNLLFLFGFIYYLILPPIIGFGDYLNDMPEVDLWMDDFNFVRGKIFQYYLICLSYLLSFYFGSAVVKYRDTKTILNQKSHHNKYYSQTFLGLAFLALSLLIVIKNQQSLFSGYAEYNTEFLGAVATMSSFALFFSLFSSHKLPKSIFILVTLLCSVVLLGLGSRMYVLIPIISLLVYKHKYAHCSWSIKKMTFIAAVCSLALIMIGSWRIGADASSRFLIYLFFAEPMFTWWSAATYLANNNLLLIEFPINYLQSFANFIPTFVYPEKSNLITSARDLYNYSSPKGADSIFVSVSANFGVVGGAVFFGFLGFYYSTVARFSKSNRFALVYYVLIVSLLPFQFFRDNFSIVNKQLFWNFLLIPSFLLIIISVFEKILFRALRKS